MGRVSYWLVLLWACLTICSQAEAASVVGLSTFTNYTSTSRLPASTFTSYTSVSRMKTDYSNAGTAPTWNQNTTGNAATATVLAAARLIDSVSFNGSGNIQTAISTKSDYANGLITATVAGTTSAGTATYTRQAGKYTRIADLMFFEIDLIWTGGTGTGNLIVTTNIPNNTSSYSMLHDVAVRAYQLVLTAAYVPTAYISVNSNTIVIQQLSTDGATGISAVPYDAAGQLVLRGFYHL